MTIHQWWLGKLKQIFMTLIQIDEFEEISLHLFWQNVVLLQVENFCLATWNPPTILQDLVTWKLPMSGNEVRIISSNLNKKMLPLYMTRIWMMWPNMTIRMPRLFIQNNYFIICFTITPTHFNGLHTTLTWKKSEKFIPSPHNIHHQRSPNK